jgi:3-oxoadipate enol-lactonase
VAEGATAVVNGVRLFHDRRGQGPPVLFVGGTGSDLRQAPSVLDGPLPKAGFEVLAYDHRGLGRSEIRDEPVTMADFADDAAALLAHVGWDRAHVMGVSFGGMVAQELAIRHPGPVDRLVLCCTSSGGAGGASYPLHELAVLPDEQRRRKQLALSDVRLADADEERIQQVLRMMEEREAVGAGEPGREIGARRQLEARAGHDTHDRLGGIGSPTLVCAGRHDGIAPVSNSEALAAGIPGAELDVFDGGHLFLLTDRRAWQRIVEFLEAP